MGWVNCLCSGAIVWMLTPFHLLMEILMVGLSIKGYTEETLLSLLHTFLRYFVVVTDPSLKERQHGIWTVPRLWGQIQV